MSTEAGEISWTKDFDFLTVEHHRRIGQFHKRLHSHGAFEVYYLISGDRHYRIDDHVLRVEKGNLVLISPGTPHETFDASTAVHERILVNFAQEYVSDMLFPHDMGLLDIFQTAQPHVMELAPSEQTQVEALMRKIVWETKTNLRGRDSSLRVYLTELLIYLDRTGGYKRDHGADHRLNGLVTDIAEFIRENYMYPITLNQLAEHFFISPHYLCRIFKQGTGETFVSHLAYWRMEEAKRLLKNSTLPVARIAEQVGYDNPIHFGRVFKEKTGHTPTEYRHHSPQG